MGNGMFDPYSTPEQTQAETRLAQWYTNPGTNYYDSHAVDYAGQASGEYGRPLALNRSASTGGVVSSLADKAGAAAGVAPTWDSYFGRHGEVGPKGEVNWAPGGAESATPWGGLAAAGLAYYQGVDHISKKRNIGAGDLFKVAYPTQGGMFGGLAQGHAQRQMNWANKGRLGMGGGMFGM